MQLLKVLPTILSADMETEIHQFFEMLSIRLYTFYYPNEYTAVVLPSQLGTQRIYSGTLFKDHQTSLKMTVGKMTSVYQLCDSYQTAVTAMKHFTASAEGIYFL